MSAGPSADGRTGRKRKAPGPLPDPKSTEFSLIGLLRDECIIVLQDVAMLTKLRDVIATPGELSIPQRAFLQSVRVHVQAAWTDNGTSEEAMKQFKEFARKPAFHLPFPKASDGNKRMNNKLKDQLEPLLFAQQAHQRDNDFKQIASLFTMMSPLKSHSDAQVKRLKGEEGAVRQERNGGQATSSAVPQIKNKEDEDNAKEVSASLTLHVDEARNTVFRTSLTIADVEMKRKTLAANPAHFNDLADTEKQLQLLVLLRASIALVSNAILVRSSIDSQKERAGDLSSLYFPATAAQPKIIQDAIQSITSNIDIFGAPEDFDILTRAAKDPEDWPTFKANGDRLLDFLVNALGTVPALQHPCEAEVRA